MCVINGCYGLKCLSSSVFIIWVNQEEDQIMSTYKAYHDLSYAHALIDTYEVLPNWRNNTWRVLQLSSISSPLPPSEISGLSISIIEQQS